MEVIAPAVATAGGIAPSGELADWRLGRISPTPTRLPIGWELVRLTSVARLESGHTPSRRHREYWDGDIPWISLHDSDGLDVPEINTTVQTIGPVGLEHSSARLLPKGTVVFSRTATVGKATVMGREMATSQDFANYVCGRRVHNHYLRHLFRFMGPEWNRLMAGSTHNSIYMPVFQHLKILLPPIGQQRAIAEALSDADTHIESLENLLAKKRKVWAGSMGELLSGKRRLPGFERERGYKETSCGALPVDWDADRIGRAIERLEAGASVNSERGKASELDTYPRVLKTGAVTGGAFDPRESKRVAARDLWRLKVSVRKETIVISRMNTVELVGESGYVPCDYPTLFVPDRMWMATVRSTVFARWLSYVLTWQRVRSQISASATGTSGSMKNISKPSFRAVEIPYPSFEEQRAIATVLSDIDAEIAVLTANVAKARQVKQGMMQELLTGRVRLI
jgi:type I restriction enzyme, S subunit